MKKITALFLASLMLVQVGFSNGILKSTTSIPIKNVQKISSDDKSSVYEFVVSKDVKDSNGNIVISEGTPVVTDIKLKKRKSVGKSGAIEVKLKSVEANNGDIIDLVGGTTVHPDDIKGKVLGVGLGVGLTIFWPMLLYLIKKGDAAILDANTTIIGKPVTDHTF